MPLYRKPLEALLETVSQHPRENEIREELFRDLFLKRGDLVPTEAELRADEGRFSPPLKALIPER